MATIEALALFITILAILFAIAIAVVERGIKAKIDSLTKKIDAVMQKLIDMQ
jgi:biopolymer transport protein ExbB/TolQ